MVAGAGLASSTPHSSQECEGELAAFYDETL
jgi:hypothetical protein